MNPERRSIADVFDHTLRSLIGLPDTATAKATTIRHITPVLELAQTFIVQTLRNRELGEYVMIEYMAGNECFRVALPPGVCETIARQRDSLTTKVRKRAAKQEAARRKAQGIQPAFLKVKGAS